MIKYAGQIDEEALGFNDYHPYKGDTFSRWGCHSFILYLTDMGMTLLQAQ